MNNWEEVKTAYTVGMLGTVTAASASLGVHRATVIRHVDALESKLGQSLFVRHTNGYTPTEAGKELIRVVKVTDEQFNLLSDKMRGLKERLSGELTITSPEFLSPLIVPGVTQFQIENPNIVTRYLVTNEMTKLEFGEAHLAVRPGRCKNEPDNVVIPFCDYTVGLYASSSYIERKGIPKNIEEFPKHGFVGRDLDMRRGPFEFWLGDHVPEENFVFMTASPLVLHLAVVAGVGIGFMPPYKARQYPELVEVIPKMEEWQVRVSLLTHRDMLETEKVRKLVQILTSENYKF